MNKALIDFQNSEMCAGDVNSLCVLESIKPNADSAKEESKDAAKELDFLVDPKYDWYQNATHIFVSMRVKKGDLRQSLEVCFGMERLQVENCGHEVLSIKLSNPITTAQSTYNCGLKKIEFKLKKASENFNWPSLEAVAGQQQAAQPVAPPTNAPLPSYPSSSKQKKNWDKVDAEVSKELSKDKPEGDAALNDLFK